jgi:hypothetical protein
MVTTALLLALTLSLALPVLAWRWPGAFARLLPTFESAGIAKNDRVPQSIFNNFGNLGSLGNALRASGRARSGTES